MKSLPAKLPKRWLIFFAVWVVLFALAPLRYMAQSQLQNSLWPLSKLFHRQNSPTAFSELALKFPADARVWAAAAEEFPDASEEFSPDQESDEAPIIIAGKRAALPLFPGQPLEERHDEERRRLDIVIEKFPHENWLIAKRLRLSWGYMFGDRVGGELSDSNLYQNQAAGKPSPERLSSDAPEGSPAGSHPEGREYPNYTPAELARVLLLCKRGQKLEPNNAFYDWTLSYFLALSWRDAQAWSALEAAAQKTAWNDHRAEEMQARMAARELLLGRPLLWEEKSRMMWAVLFPEYSRYREYARILSWNSIKAQRKENHAQALRLAGDLAKVAALMRENSRYLIEGLIAVAMEAIAVGSPTYDARHTGRMPKTRGRGFAAEVPNFQAYAIRHGRRDLANWVARDSQRATQFRGNARPFGTDLLGLSFFQAALIGALWQAGVLLLLMLPCALYGYLFLGAVFRIRLARRYLQLANPNPKISAREIWNGALACGGVHAIGAALCAVVVLGLTGIAFFIAIGEFASMWRDFLSWWNSTFASASGTGGPSLWEALAYQTLGVNERAGRGSGRFKIVVALIPILLGALWCAGRARRWQEAQRGHAAPRAGVLSLVKAILSGKIFAHAMDYDVAGTGVLLARGFLFGAFCVAWVAIALWQEDDGAIMIPMVLGPLFFALLIGEALSRWRRSTHRRGAARFGMRLLRESWLGWLALGSALFLLTLLVSLPVRHHADRALDRIIELGEIKALQTGP
jgi:hypothetical protein